MISFGPYSKTISAVIGAIIAFATLVSQSPTPGITSSEWITGAIMLAAALGVYGFTNSPMAKANNLPPAEPGGP